MVDAFAPSALSHGQASSSASASPSYAKFLHTLTKSSSDKNFMFQKKYREELGPILEAVNEEDLSEEQVDYDTTNSESAATSERYIIPGTGVMALAVPSRQERAFAELSADGSQPENGGTQEDPLSQVDNPIDMETADDTGINENLHQAGGGPQTVRMSSRIISQDLHTTRIPQRASRSAAARDVTGTNLTLHNSFALLDDDDMHNRALEMGVNPETFTLEKINYLKDLEQARHAIAVVQNAQETEVESDSDRVLLLGFGRDQDLEDEDDFTPVVSRRSWKKRRSAGKARRWKGTPTKSGGSFGGAQIKSCAASVKVGNDHPLSDIVTGTRCRKKTQSIYDRSHF
jgi:hypothetical protein